MDSTTADELKQQLQGALQENGQLRLELQQYESERDSALTPPQAEAAPPAAPP
jgi:regulator of replication initiation timing